MQDLDPGEPEFPAEIGHVVSDDRARTRGNGKLNDVVVFLVRQVGPPKEENIAPTTG